MYEQRYFSKWVIDIMYSEIKCWELSCLILKKKKKIAESEEEVTMKKKKKVNGIHFNCLLYFLMISIAQTV